MVLPDYVESIKTYTFDTASGYKSFPFVYTSVSVQNKANKPVKIYFSKYNRDSYAVVPENSFREFAVTSNYIEFVYDTGVSSPNLTIEVVHFTNEDFLVNRFPNLFIRDVNGNYVQYNPLNTDGFFTETYSFGDSTNRPYNSNTIIKVDYWLNGQKVSTDSNNFYTDLFNTLITNFINENFSYSNVNDVLAPLPGGQTSDLIQRIKNWWESIDRPLNDEYVGGWAKLETFDKNLSMLSFVLDAGDKIEYPFVLLGFNIENVSSSPAQVKVYDETNSTTITINPNDTYVGNFEKAKRFEVLSGRVKITFSGYLVKMIEFAPIVNIYYPLGFDESSGRPNDVYTKFLNDLNAFENYLASIKFSGRVIKYKWTTYQAQDREVWNADYQVLTRKFDDINLPYHEIRIYLKDWYAYAKIEDYIIARVWDENYSVLGPYGRPKSLEEIIQNDNIVVVLGKNFSSFSPPTRAQEKRNFIWEIIKSQYLGPYAGSLNAGYFVN